MTILRVSRLQAPHSSQKGLTLFECLVAILVVNLAIAMLTMPLAIVAATRLRNDRINKASEVARQSLDRLRAMMEQGVNVKVGGDSSGLLPPQATAPDLSLEPHPTSVVECSNGQWFTSDPQKACLQRVGIHEFAVQIIRGAVVTNSANQVLSYPVQVRVYEKRAIKSSSSSPPTVPIEAQPVLFTAASDQIEAPNKENPLAVLSTCILRADSSEALSSLLNSQSQNSCLFNVGRQQTLSNAEQQQTLSNAEQQQTLSNAQQQQTMWREGLSSPPLPSQVEGKPGSSGGNLSLQGAGSSLSSSGGATSSSLSTDAKPL